MLQVAKTNMGKKTYCAIAVNVREYIRPDSPAGEISEVERISIA